MGYAHGSTGPSMMMVGITLPTSTLPAIQCSDIQHSCNFCISKAGKIPYCYRYHTKAFFRFKIMIFINCRTTAIGIF